MATEGGFLDLPRPVVVGVLRFLPLRSLVAARCIAKRLADIVDEALRSRDCLDVRDQDGPATNLAIQWLQRNAAVMTNVKQLHAAGNVLLTSLTALANASAGAEVLRRLTRLTVDSCKCLTDKDLPGVLELCGNLEALDFSGCGKLSDASALTVGRCCPGVKELGLADWHTLTDDALDYLSRHCPLLEACVVDGCIRVTTKGVRALAANCRGLRRLSTQRCCAITDAALSALAASTCTELVLRQCPKLRGLGALRSLRLEVLDITGCPRINDDELRAALEGAGPTLNTLVLNGCVGLSGDVLSVVAALCPRLQSLSVRGIGSITNAHLHALAAAGCTTLLELNTIWCNKVTDYGLELVMAANPRLQRLEVEGCYQLTDHFLTLVRRLLPASLNALNVRLCPNLSAAALLELVAETGVRSLHVMSTLPSDDETTAFVRQAKQLKPQLTVYY